MSRNGDKVFGLTVDVVLDWNTKGIYWIITILASLVDERSFEMLRLTRIFYERG